METLSSAFVDIDSNKLQEAIPEYLWFVIAIIGISAIIYILHRLANYMISTVKTLEKSSIENSTAIEVMQEVLRGIQRILTDHDADIRELRGIGKKTRGQ